MYLVVSFEQAVHLQPVSGMQQFSSAGGTPKVNRSVHFLDKEKIKE